MSSTKKAAPQKKKAGAFDIRNVIGALIGLYGLVLLASYLLLDPGTNPETNLPKESVYNLYTGPGVGCRGGGVLHLGQDPPHCGGRVPNSAGGATMNQSERPHDGVRVTRTTLSDGRELLYFDDEPDYVSGEKTRKLTDERTIPQAITESELRRDPLTGEWNCYAAHRMNRTFMPPANENPLAPTIPGQLPTEVPASDYDVVVFENRFPSLSLHMEVPEDFATAVDGAAIFPRKPALARCEVVCFTPNVADSFRDLSFTRARTVIEAWAHRSAELSQIDGVRLVFPFENRGKEIGVTLQHPHGQIYSYPYLPPRAAAIVAQAKAHREATGRDVFDDILSAEVKSGRRILHRGEFFTAFVPAAAKWPVEVMVMANRAVGDFSELTSAEKDELAQVYLDMLRRIDRFFPGLRKHPILLPGIRHQWVPTANTGVSICSSIP